MIVGLSLVGRMAATLLLVLAIVLVVSFLAHHRHAQVQRRRIQALRGGKGGPSRASAAHSAG